jgi:hypothetical protein
MTRRTALFLPIPLLLTAAEPPSGRWRSVTTTRGGIGATYTFRPDGTAEYATVAMATLRYEAEGAQLKVEGEPVTVAFPAGGRLRLKSAAGEASEFTRVGPTPDPARPLLGEWRGVRVMEGRQLPMLYQFRPDGTLQFVITIRALPARLLPRGAAFRIEVPGLVPRDLAVIAPGQKITIAEQGKTPYEFVPF